MMRKTRSAWRRFGYALIATATFSTVFAVATSSPTAYAAVPAPRLVTIKPGAFSLVSTAIHVNVVLVGYSAAQVDSARLESLLPHEAVPPIRSPLKYGLNEAVGLDLSYDYTVRSAGRTFDNDFFTHLAHTGDVAAPDSIQAYYNGQVHHTVTVGPKVRYIDATSTERWLEQHAALQLGINPSDYTVFLIDWYGRGDFQFHTYTNNSVIDPDTGVKPSKVTDWTNVRAWGGATGPSWFYDLSAGPVLIDDSYEVDDPNIHGVAPVDYRIPPIWDYGSTGYRAFDDLTGDLARIVRYVAIDELFTSSPLYDPEESLPDVNGKKEITFDIFEGDPTHNGRDDIHPSIVQAQHQRLEPYYPITVSVRDLPLSGDAQTAYATGTLATVTPGCWTPFGTPLADFFCTFRDDYPTYFSPPGPNAVLPAVGYTVADNPVQRTGFTGIALDDFHSGVPTIVTTVDTAQARQNSQDLAYTFLLMHEAGHFIGLSHPHDGVDPEQLIQWSPFGSFDFARAGDQSATVMSYVPGAPRSFSVFDQDNLARWHVARLLFLADVDASRVLAQPANAQANAYLRTADAAFTAALAAMRLEQWVTAGSFAASGYRDIQRADAKAGIPPLNDFFGNELWRDGGSPAASATAARTAPATLYLHPSATPVRFVGPAATRQCTARDTCDLKLSLPHSPSRASG